MNRASLISIASILFAAAAFAAYVSAYQYLDGMRDRIFARESGMSAERLRESRVESVRAIFAATSVEREALSRFFVRQEEVAGVVSRLEKLGAESGVAAEVSGIGIESESLASARGGKLRAVDITLQAVGTRAAAEAYLRRVELFPYALSLEEVSLEKLLFTETRDERWRLAVRLRIGAIQ
ncbi:MAG TPA: hypothetical protein VD967_01825 [Candidatus Paceibacterota bacterium]|nr:hypothetical protein [Candidatus Paceibacterota bacterium]